MTTARQWQDLTTADFAALDATRTVAVLPVAAIEQHGPHLPLAVDALINQGIVERALALMPDDLPVLFLPAMTVGLSPEHADFPGTLSLEPETVLRLWGEIGRSVARAGLRKMLIFNSHGGNAPLLEVAARRLRIENGLLVAFASWQHLGLPDGLLPEDEINHGIHGGAVETAMMLHLRPDLVRRDRMADFAAPDAPAARRGARLTLAGKVGIGWLTQDLNPAGAIGDATRADEETGRRLVDHAASGLVALLAEFVRLSPDDPAGSLADPAALRP